MNELIELSENSNFKIMCNTMWLLKRSMSDNMNASDIMIKMLAIDNYFGKNDYGMRLYCKMQKIRVSQNKLIEREKADNKENFIKLIESIKKYGFDDKYPIELNKNFEVFEGYHRLACALYFNIDIVPVKFNKMIWNLKYDYSLEWFKNNGMEDYIYLIKEKYEKTLKVEKEEFNKKNLNN